MAAESQLALWTPEEHAEALHRQGRGTVFLCLKTGGRGLKQFPVTVRELPSRIRDFPKIDSYISQNRFDGRRKIAYLREAGALFTDIDFYKVPELEGLHPFLVFDKALDLLQRERIPEPSLAISSGRGLYLLWLHSPIEFDQLASWNVCQDRICRTLRPLGADPSVRHAASILRIIGSTNSKAFRPVEVLTGSEELWEWDDLAREIIPDPVSKPTKILTLEAARRRGPSFFARSRWNGATLWSQRFEELRNLIYSRWPAGIPTGYRDISLFLGSVALSWVVEPARIETEIQALARLCRGNWRVSHTQNSISSSVKRAIAAARGELVEWNGRSFDPRYRFTSERLAELLDVSDDEARSLNLRHFVSERYKRERRARAERERRARTPKPGKETHTKPHLCHSGYQRRVDYEANSLSQTKPWEALGISRRTYYRWAKAGKLPDDCK